MAGANIDRCQIWQASRITKKLLSLLNSPPSLCAEYKVSSKLEHLLFFVQNYGLTDDRCQQLQVSILTAVKNYKKILSLLNSPPSLCAENEVYQNWSICRSSSKTMAWKMTAANIGSCHESQKTIAVNEFSTFKLFTMQNFEENG